MQVKGIYHLNGHLFVYQIQEVLAIKDKDVIMKILKKYMLL